jgi:hypothetical protein
MAFSLLCVSLYHQIRERNVAFAMESTFTVKEVSLWMFAVRYLKNFACFWNLGILQFS